MNTEKETKRRQHIIAAYNCGLDVYKQNPTRSSLVCMQEEFARGYAHGKENVAFETARKKLVHLLDTLKDVVRDYYDAVENYGLTNGDVVNGVETMYVNHVIDDYLDLLGSNESEVLFSASEGDNGEN